MSERIHVTEADITTLDVDAIVNAAHPSLLGGGGVDGAIHRAAGPELLAACRKRNCCSTGDAKITSGYALTARRVIHTVGPVWNGGGGKGEDDLLAGCYRRSLEIAVEENLASIAFPAISTGAYRFPLERATKIAVREARRHLGEQEVPATVVFCCFGPEAYAGYWSAIGQ